MADLVTTAILLARGYHEGDPVAAWALAHGGLAALAGQKVVAVAVVLALAPPGFRVFPRTALAILALLSLLAAAAVTNNIVLLLTRQ